MSGLIARVNIPSLSCSTLHRSSVSRCPSAHSTPFLSVPGTGASEDGLKCRIVFSDFGANFQTRDSVDFVVRYIWACNLYFLHSVFCTCVFFVAVLAMRLLFVSCLSDAALVIYSDFWNQLLKVRRRLTYYNFPAESLSNMFLNDIRKFVSKTCSCWWDVELCWKFWSCLKRLWKCGYGRVLFGKSTEVLQNERASGHQITRKRGLERLPANLLPEKNRSILRNTCSAWLRSFSLGLSTLCSGWIRADPVDTCDGFFSASSQNVVSLPTVQVFGELIQWATVGSMKFQNGGGLWWTRRIMCSECHAWVQETLM